MLALSCARATKLKDEGRAYFSIGIIYDNIKEYNAAIEY